MNRHLISALLLLAALASAAAQSRRGAGISGHRIADGVDASYLRTEWGPPDSVRLAVAVLWRRNIDWPDTPPRDQAAVRAMIDSVQADALRRGVMVASDFPAYASSWMEYDERAGAVLVLKQRYRVPTRDSALVLFVDRADHVGSSPNVSKAILVCIPTPDGTQTSDHPSQAWVAALHETIRHWDTCLLNDQRVTAFLNRRSSR